MYHIIGDVHGDIQQLTRLLGKLGYERPDPTGDPYNWIAPRGYQLVSIGDLVDRGPDSLACLRTIQKMVETGNGLMVMGNHEYRYLQLLRNELGLDSLEPLMSPGRLFSKVQILGLSDPEKRELLQFLESLPIYLDLDDGRLIACHARWENRFRNLGRDELIDACARGTTESSDPPVTDQKSPHILGMRDGMAHVSVEGPLPDRADWVRGWTGPATVVWGHQVITPGYVSRIGHTISVESGAYLGAALSAYDYARKKVIQVAGTGVSYKQVLRQYRESSYLLFPDSLASFQRRVRDEGLINVDEYLMFLDRELERLGAPAMYPELIEAHRAMHRIEV